MTIISLQTAALEYSQQLQRNNGCHGITFLQKIAQILIQEKKTHFTNITSHWACCVVSRVSVRIDWLRRYTPPF